MNKLRIGVAAIAALIGTQSAARAPRAATWPPRRQEAR
jgi:hypothetical protein